jgi:hypothetical protein
MNMHLTHYKNTLSKAESNKKEKKQKYCQNSISKMRNNTNQYKTHKQNTRYTLQLKKKKDKDFL